MMLCLSRKVGEVVHVGDDTEVMVLGVKTHKDGSHTVRLGFTAPLNVTILRDEVKLRGIDERTDRKAA